MATFGVAEFFTRTAAGAPCAHRTDADLLGEFAGTRSDEAFAELARRFAPLVWAVCRRTVGHRQQAEDAFQAVFLVLSRKPSAVNPPSALAGWLHAVAVHTALRARALAERRRRWEALVPTIPDRAAPGSADPADPNLPRLLDEEVARLPDKLRAAVVLCELDGLGRREAARRLGIAEGTLSSRLAAARRRLAARLRGRGLAPGAGGLAVLLARPPATAAPVAGAGVSERASALAEGVIRTMFLGKLKLLTAVALVAAAILTVGLWSDRGATSEPPRQTVRGRSYAPAPQPAPPVRAGTILLWVDEQPLLLKPDGTPLPSPDPIPKVHSGVGSGNAQLAPDGARIAFEVRGAEIRPPAAPAGAVVRRNRTVLKILELGGKKETKTLDTIDLNGFHWLGDGKTLYVRGQEVAADGAVAEKLENWVYDPATDKRTAFKVPEHFVIRAIGPDGKTAVADEWKMSPELWHQHAHLWTIGGEKPVPLLELNQGLERPIPKFSPDGKRVLCNVSHYGKHTPQGNGSFALSDFKCNDIVVIDLATKKRAVVKELGETPEWQVAGLAWAPDGKRIAYVETKRVPRPPGAPADQNPFRVIVADPDGKNAKEIYVAEGSWLVGFDWR